MTIFFLAIFFIGKPLRSFNSYQKASVFSSSVCFKCVLLSVLNVNPVTDDCRLLQYKPPMKNRTLIGHVIKSLLVNTADGCEINCFMNDDCMSLNFGPLADGKRVCELSSSDHDIHPEDLKHHKEFIYRPVWVSLSKLISDYKTQSRVCITFENSHKPPSV